MGFLAADFSDQTQYIVVITVCLLPIIPLFAIAFYVRYLDTSHLPPSTPISKLFIYPIKSCHGISVPSARLLPTGLDLDRQWMWVTYPDYKFLTIRNHAKMTLIRPTYDSKTDSITVKAPAPDSSEDLSFSFPAHPSQEWLDKHTEIVSATVWDFTTPAHCFSTNLTGAFNKFFGKEVRLVYKLPVSSSPRPLSGNGAKKYLGRDASTCFADLMPVLVGSEKSIGELNERLKQGEDVDFDVTRFRPNILVQGTKPWDEDRWKTIRLSDASAPPPSLVTKLKRAIGTDALSLDVVARCARCRVPNVNPETAEEHKRQPWDTLMKYRRIDEGIKFKPCFGMLCVPKAGGMVNVGMQLEITEITDKHKYVQGF